MRVRLSDEKSRCVLSEKSTSTRTVVLLATEIGATDALSSGAVRRDASTLARTAVALGSCRFTAASPTAAVALHTRHSTVSSSPHSRSAPTCTDTPHVSPLMLAAMPEVAMLTRSSEPASSSSRPSLKTAYATRSPPSPS